MISPPDIPRRLDEWRAALVALLVIVSLAVTLPWQEFSSGNENLVVAAAVESVREGKWLVPQLNGEPRLRKPPLVTWVTMLALPPAFVEQLADPATRAAGYERMQSLVRVQLVAVVALTLLATFHLARRLGVAGWIAVSVVGSSYLMMRFGRNVTTDVYLMMFVTIAHALTAEALLGGRRRLLLLTLAGVATGLGFLCKGPVVLLQTLLPWVAVAWVLRSASPWTARPAIASALAFLISFVAVAAPWFVYVAVRTPNVWSLWTTEVTRVGATPDSDPVFIYLGMPAFLLPWTVFAIVGLIDAVVRVRRRLFDGTTIMLVLSTLPIVVMAFFPDRKERYLLPMLVPAGLLAAHGVMLWLKSMAQATRVDRGVLVMHAMLLAGGITGLVVWWKVEFGYVDLAWWPFAMIWALVAAWISFMLWPTRRARASGLVVVVTVLVAQLLSVAFAWTYPMTRRGRSEMRPLADVIVRDVAGARLYQVRGTFAPADLSLYANRAVEVVDSIDAIPDRPGPEVLIVKQGKRESEPIKPDGFEHLADVPRDSNRWWAFVRR